MIQLPDVTVVCATTKDHGKSIEAIHKTLQHIAPKKVILFSDVLYISDVFHCYVIDRFKSVEDYNRFIFKELHKHINTSHILVIQHDGYVIDGEAWDDAFLKYDYIGAPWTYTDGRNVGNGGFSLRSTRLHQILSAEEFEYFSPEDEKICRYYRQTLEMKHGIKFAPEEVAHRFSYEMHQPKVNTFGFHNYFHYPYKKPIILKRSGATGDIIMMEPVMEALYHAGYRIILDTPFHYFNLFSNHFYSIEHLENVQNKEDVSGYRVVNLDMAYEVQPREHAISSYAKACGITIENRNPRLIFNKSQSLLDNYVVFHTDDTDMHHRNVHGMDWNALAEELQRRGYLVLRVGTGNGAGGTKVNTNNLAMLGWIIAGAKFFIGIDSGPGQIAVATGVKSFLFFGSVDPKLRYFNFENIFSIQNPCPIGKSGCYHEVISTTGQDCQHNITSPGCITHKTGNIIIYILNRIS